MAKIIQLPPEISQRIAAGEVIERPASVVKEAVENALDAGARSIRIDLLDGGKGLIRVTDDGQGMSPEDAEVCFESHATSKIASVDDLEEIATLGFRGEALASISAVARVTLKTAEGSKSTGLQIDREGGRLVKVQEVAHPPGTMLEVRDLFFNLPARKKFLRSDRAELARIVRFLTPMTLAYPGVDFRLLHGSRRIFDYPAVDTLKERIFQIFGRAVLDNLLEIDCREDGLRLHGFCSRPPSARGDRKQQLFFINRRLVKDATMQAAVNQAYRSFLEKDRFAQAFLFMEIPYSEVDVNVHPAKAEVRFRDTQAVFQFIHRCLEQRVLKHLGLKEISPRSEVREGPPLPQESGWQIPLITKKPDAPSPYPTYAVTPSDEDGTAPRVLGQYQGFYIIAVDREGVLIIDQHNAHERVLFERYREIDLQQSWPRTLPLHPLVLELTPSQVLCFQENREHLEAAGFQVDTMGGQSYAIKEYPDLFQEAEAADVFLALLEDVGQEKIDKKKHRLLATLACKTAVKAGEALPMEKMIYLVAELFKSSNSALCPHGRPITLRLRKSEIDKGLGR